MILIDLPRGEIDLETRWVRSDPEQLGLTISAVSALLMVGLAVLRIRERRAGNAETHVDQIV